MNGCEIKRSFLFKFRGNRGAVRIKFEAVVIVAGAMEPFAAFAMVKHDLKTSAFNTALRA